MPQAEGLMRDLSPWEFHVFTFEKRVTAGLSEPKRTDKIVSGPDIPNGITTK
jgi:hypothetical protein